MEPGNNEFQMFKVKGSEDKFVLSGRVGVALETALYGGDPGTLGEHLATPLSETGDVAYLTDVMERGE